MRHAFLAVTLVSLAGCATAPGGSATAMAPLAVTAHWPVPGEGRWDLLDVDPGTHHLYLSRGDRVQVLDTTTGALVGEVPGTDGVHGIAVVPSLGRGYATDGRSDRVTEFDLRTLAVLREIPVSGHSPDAILFDPHSRHLFVFNAHSNNASIVDPATGREIATIAFEGNPELAATDGSGHVFVNLESGGALVDIDSDSAHVAHTWTLDGCEEPTGLALDVAHARLFSACANGIMAVTDAHDGHAVARVPIGEGPDGLAFDAASALVLVPNGRSGTITVVHEDTPDHYVVRQSLATRMSARTIVLDATSHRAYLPAAQFGPKPTGDGNARAPMVADSFEVVVVGPHG